MATISPTSSALDVPSLVSQLMALERKPIDNLNTKVTSYQAKISALGTISGLTSTFKSALKTLQSSLQGYSATPSNPGVFSASATSSAVAGNYTLNVASLAQAQNLVAKGQTSSTAAIGTGAATTVTFDFGTTLKNATVGVDGTTVTVASTANLAVGATITGPGFPPGTTIASITDGTTFATSAAGTTGAATLFAGNGSGTKSITIDGTNNTLEGMRDAINAAAMGVSATIVNDGSNTPYRLVLTSNNTGITNSIKISTNGGDVAVDSLLANDPTTGTQNLTETVSAKNAEFTVNGIQISKSSNNINDAIQGVSLTLTQITTTPGTLTVSRDTNSINTAASGFVDAYNALASQLKSRTAYGTATTAGPPLAGDGSVRLMLEQLRGIVNSPATPASGGTLTMLSQVGISYQTDGTLKLDSSKLNSEMNKNFSDVSNLFSSATGFLTRMNTWSTSVLSNGGLISTRTANINTSIKNANDQISRLEYRMESLKKQYTTTYTNLNGFLNSMNNTSAYLTSQFFKGTSS